jgi:hypothetical protein
MIAEHERQHHPAWSTDQVADPQQEPAQQSEQERRLHTV